MRIKMKMPIAFKMNSKNYIQKRKVVMFVNVYALRVVDKHNVALGQT